MSETQQSLQQEQSPDSQASRQRNPRSKYLWRRRIGIAVVVGAVAAGGWLVVRGDGGSNGAASEVQAASAQDNAPKLSKAERKLNDAFQDALAWHAEGKSLTKWQPPADIAAASSKDYIVLVTMFKGKCYTLGNAPGYDGTAVKADPSGIKCQQSTLESLARSMAAYERTKPAS